VSFSEGQGLFELSIASCREFRSQAPPISRATIYSNSQISGTLATNSRHHITTLSSGRPNGHSAWYSSRASEVKTTVQGICRSSLRLLRGWLGGHPGCCANNRGYADNHRCCCFLGEYASLFVAECSPGGRGKEEGRRDRDIKNRREETMS